MKKIEELIDSFTEFDEFDEKFDEFAEENAPHHSLHLTESDDLIGWAGGNKFTTILADPPWRFQNSTGKVAPEHKRLMRYNTMSLKEILALPVGDIVEETAHLYLWVPNALLPEGLAVMQAWGFSYKTNLVWHKSATMAVPMAAASASTSAMSRSLSCLACAGSMPGPSIPVAGKSITSKAKSGNTRGSLMSFIPSSRPALPGHLRSCSRADHA